MKQITLLRLFGIALLLATLNPQLSTARAQGDLTPPGAPAPTMKSLDQIEPRIIINALNTPGDGTSSFIISNSGSYYFTGNISGVSGKYGIRIKADNVTVDLNGFTFLGVVGSLRGITVFGGRNIIIQNGIVRNWSSDGVDVRLGTNSAVEKIRASNNGGSGIAVGPGSTVINCTARENAVYGIEAGDGCVITQDTAVNNLLGGIFTGLGNTVATCSVMGNTNRGIWVDVGSTVTGCSARGNRGAGIDSNGQCTILNCTAYNNLTNGIVTATASSIIGNTCSANVGSGILVFGDCLILNNNSSHNLSNGDGSLGNGIRTEGQNNRIDGNHTIGNDRVGIRSIFSSTADYIIRNTSINNPFGNYSPASGPYVGPFTTPASATNAWSNF